MVRKVGAITIGQSPRVDVVPEMKEILGENIEIIEGGALDGLTQEEIAALAPGPEDYVLVTRLRDGSSVRIAERYIVPRMQTQIDKLVAEGAEIIVLLCTGEFPNFSSSKLILKPQVILHHFTSGIATGRRLGVIVPDKDQVEQARARWAGVGEVLRVEAASPYGPREEIWRAASSLKEWQAEVIVLDCIGFNLQMKREVNQHTGVPVILPRTVLARTLQELLS
ncbi:AroM family protein [Thermanaeromonas toyohensis]|uniref:AroM family protein n=1 Tax=Thermanaeromonas toyohensis TaxID=161154 RepID=UPI0009FE52A6|nr:AroM family protein [Thermanaeromonas toyohensis]